MDDRLTTDPDPTELRAIAARLRADAWPLAETWLELAAVASPMSTLRGGDVTSRFGGIPAFIAALAHALELRAADVSHPRAGDDDILIEAAGDHARARARAGYDQRELVAEFVLLRRVLWEHVAGLPGTVRSTFETERLLNVLLDTVLLEAVDQFVGELTASLLHRAERDPLTGLLNRQAFNERFQAELARAERHDRELTVVVIDLDAFKQVNDTLGHLAGDAVLTRVASLLSAHTRDEDIVGRLGGDEFAVVLVEADANAARELIRRVRIHLAPARRRFDLPIEFGVSFGSATYPEVGTTVDELLFAADAGMYRAKGPGRGERMEEAGSVPDVARLQVLVADDDPGVRALCAAVLGEAGFDVIEAVDGVDAVEQIQALQPDVVLLDVSMPRLDGWQVVGQLRAAAITSEVPVVMLTGNEDLAQLERAVAAGALDFMPKPFHPSSLVTTVHRVLEVAWRSEDAEIVA